MWFVILHGRAVGPFADRLEATRYALERQDAIAVVSDSVAQQRYLHLPVVRPADDTGTVSQTV